MGRVRFDANDNRVARYITLVRISGGDLIAIEAKLSCCRQESVQHKGQVPVTSISLKKQERLQS